MLNGNKWAVAVEYAIGRMLNSFIVTDHKDFRLLKQCAKEANYGHLQIIIYDFSIPRYIVRSISVFLSPCSFILCLVSFFSLIFNMIKYSSFLVRLMISEHMLPHTKHPSTLSILQCENHTVINVLVDLVIDKIFCYTVVNIPFQGFLIAIKRIWKLVWDHVLFFIFVFFFILYSQLLCDWEDVLSPFL